MSSQHHKKSKKELALKIASLISVVRGYNILGVATAQYIASLFLFSKENPLKTLLNLDLFLIVLVTSLVIASGYIINNFYDKISDGINRPIKSKIDSVVSQEKKLSLSLFLNSSAVILAFIVSWKATVFFLAYIFSIWFYSHKLKKYSFIGLLSATILAILPFFALFVYFGNYSKSILLLAFFLFLLLLQRELVKEMQKTLGDIVQNYRTVAVKLNDRTLKIILLSITLITFFVIYLLLQIDDLQPIKLFLYLSFLVLIVNNCLMYLSKKTKVLYLIHNFYKSLILLGMLSLILLK